MGGSPTYHVVLWAGQTGEGREITRGQLRGAIERLLESTGDVLFHFSGHGYLASSGGFICTADATEGDFGISMGEIAAIGFVHPVRGVSS